MSDEGRIITRLGPEFVQAARSDVITDEMVKSVRAKGVGWVCSHCVHLWWGINRGRAQCWALFAKRKCGGPMVELAFPEYKGPISRQSFPTFCFVCGKEADGAVKIDGVNEMVGVCKTHEEFVHTMRPRKPQEKQKIIMKARMEVPS